MPATRVWPMLLATLLAHPAMADYGVLQTIQVLPANTADPAYFYQEIASSSVSSDSFDSGLRTSELDRVCEEFRDVSPFDCIRYYPIGIGRAASSADLAAGRLQIEGNASGYLSLASSMVTLYDALTFDLPDGMTQATIGFSMTVSGQATPRTPPPNESCRTDGYASVNLNGTGVDSFPHPLCSESFVGRTIYGQATVFDGVPSPIQAILTGYTHTTIDAGASYDLTGDVLLSLPAGVSFTSESGTFLLPEPDGDRPILMLAACLALTRTRRGPFGRPSRPARRIG